MTILSSGELELLRGNLHTSSTYISVEQPETIWSAIVGINPDRFSDVIDFNTGVGNVSLIREGCEVWIGQGVNSKNVGTLRLREFNSGDGITGNIKVSSNNYEIETGDIISIKLSFRLRPKFPRIAGTALNPDFRKDFDIPYTNQHVNVHPVVIAGGNRAMWLDDAIINPHLENSYPMAIGATLTFYNAIPLYTSGSAPTVILDNNTGIGTIQFNSTGQYWIEFSVTDSNGTIQRSYRFYRIHDVSDMPLVDVGITTITGSFSAGGYSCSIKPYDDATLSDIDDETIVIIWEDATYGGVDGSITLIPDNSNTLISGYFRNESIERGLEDGTGSVSFEVHTLQQVMSNHYMFSMSLAAVQGTPSQWYEYHNLLTVLRGVHSFWKWQSTVLEISDVIGLNSDSDLLRPYTDLAAGTLYSIPNGLMQNTGIRYKVICDHSGAIHTTPDLQLLTNDERAILTEVFELEMSDSSSVETIIRKPPNRTAMVKTSGFSWDGSFKSNGCPAGSNNCPDSQPYCSTSGLFPDDDGKSITNFDRQTVRSQTHTNQIAGRKFGAINNLYPELRIKTHGNYFGVFDPAFPYFYTKIYQQADTIRGFTITDKKSWLRSVTTTLNPNAGTAITNVVLEVEVEELQGVFEECVTDLPTEFEPPIIPPPPNESAGCTEPIYTAGTSGFHRFGCGSWLQTTTEDTYDMQVDPYYWSRVWRGGLGYVKRSIDHGDTWIDVTPSNPPNDASDNPAPTSDDVIFEHLGVSYPNEGEFAFLANWDNGEKRVWIVKTIDNGVSWDWRSISFSGGQSIVDPEGRLGDPYHTFITDEDNLFSAEPIMIGGHLSVHIISASVNYTTPVKNPYVKSTITLDVIPDPILDSADGIQLFGSCVSNDTFTIAISNMGSCSNCDCEFSYDRYFLKSYEENSGSIIEVSGLEVLGAGVMVDEEYSIHKMNNSHFISLRNYNDGSSHLELIAYTSDPIAAVDTVIVDFDYSADDYHYMSPTSGLLLTFNVGGIDMVNVDTSSNTITVDTPILLEMCYSTLTPDIHAAFIPYNSTQFFYIGRTLVGAVCTDEAFIGVDMSTGISTEYVHNIDIDYPGSQITGGANIGNNTLLITLNTGEALEYTISGLTITGLSDSNYYTANTVDHNQTKILNTNPVSVMYQGGTGVDCLEIEGWFTYYQKNIGFISEQRDEFFIANSPILHNDDLYIAVSHTTNTQPDIYVFDGDKFVHFYTLTIPNIANDPYITDMISFGGYIYLSVAYRVADIPGVFLRFTGIIDHSIHTFTGTLNPNTIVEVDGEVYVGTSDNITPTLSKHLFQLSGASLITPETTSSTPPIFKLADYNNVLFAGTQGQLREFNGLTWTDIAPASNIHALKQVGSNLYFADGITGDIFSYDGALTSLIGTVPSGIPKVIIEYNGLMYILIDEYGVMSHEYSNPLSGLEIPFGGDRTSYNTGSKIINMGGIVYDDLLIYSGGNLVINDGFINNLISEQGGSDYNAEGLGVDIGRSFAQIIYATFYSITNSLLIVLTFDTNLDLLGSTTLASGVVNRSEWAFPISSWYGDSTAYLIGKFEHPSAVNYVTATVDGGTTWLDSTVDLNGNMAGSLYEYGDGTLQFVENRASSLSDLYLYDGVANNRGIIPINQTVYPHGMGVNSRGTYIASDTAQAYMVTKTIYPLTTYTNYTFNHSILGNIRSIEVSQ